MGRLSDYINRMNEQRTVKQMPACTEDLIIHLGLPTKVERRLMGSYGDTPLPCFKWWLENGDVERTTRGIGAARVKTMLNQLKHVEAVAPAEYVGRSKLDVPDDHETGAAGMEEDPQMGEMVTDSKTGARFEVAQGSAAAELPQQQPEDQRHFGGEDYMERAAAVLGASLSIVNKYSEATQQLVGMIEQRTQAERDMIEQLAELGDTLGKQAAHLADVGRDQARLITEMIQRAEVKPQAPNPAQPEASQQPVDAEPVPETYHEPPTEAAAHPAEDEPHAHDPIPGPAQQKQYRHQLWEDAREMEWQGAAVKMMCKRHGEGQNAMQLTQGTWDAIFQDLHDPQKRDHYNQQVQQAQ